MDNLTTKKTFCLPSPHSLNFLEAKLRKNPSPPAVADEREEELCIPFANKLPLAVYTAWCRYTYWSRLQLKDVLALALEAYLKDKPDASRPLPKRKQANFDKKITKAEVQRRALQ